MAIGSRNSSRSSLIARALPAGALVLLTLLLAPAPAAAQVDNVVTFNLGYFGVVSESSRGEDDVLFRNLDYLAFDLSDFNGFTFGGEYALGLGRFFEAGVGAGYYQRTVPSVYREFVDSDGTEIAQDLKLRIAPVTFLGRFFPVTREAPVQPYVGGGLGIFAWRYSETGEFIDFNGDIFRASYSDSGNAFGPVALGGVRFPISRQVALGGEFRYQWATADLDPNVGFAADKLDLGGYNWLFTAAVRF
jgi:outer membrane protein W